MSRARTRSSQERPWVMSSLQESRSVGGVGDVAGLYCTAVGPDKGRRSAPRLHRRAEVAVAVEHAHRPARPRAQRLGGRRVDRPAPSRRRCQRPVILPGPLIAFRPLQEGGSPRVARLLFLYRGSSVTSRTMERNAGGVTASDSDASSTSARYRPARAPPNSSISQRASPRGTVYRVFTTRAPSVSGHSFSKVAAGIWTSHSSRRTPAPDLTVRKSLEPFCRTRISGSAASM